MRTLMRRRPLPYDADAARKHLLRADPVMRDIVKRGGPLEIEVRGKPYEALLRSVLYQQLAGPAAAAIERRFLALFDGRIPAPAQLAVMTDETLRTAGVSRQKASYFRSIGQHFSDDGALADRTLRRASDDDVIEAVTQIRGVGRWTADMLLMFCLGRPDVLPVGDLGIQHGMKLAYGLDAMPKPPQMIEIAEPWRPYRSAASWYLWRLVDIVDTM
jgi:DNA-3-methyladenine glycosylase II